MIDPPGLPLVPQAGGQFIQQSLATSGGLQQRSSTVGTALALVKLGNDSLRKIPGNNKHCVVLSSDNKEASFVAQTLSSQHVCNRGGFFCFQISSDSRIMRARTIERHDCELDSILLAYNFERF